MAELIKNPNEDWIDDQFFFFCYFMFQCISGVLNFNDDDGESAGKLGPAQATILLCSFPFSRFFLLRLAPYLLWRRFRRLCFGTR
jgi:hypothetical protein